MHHTPSGGRKDFLSACWQLAAGSCCGSSPPLPISLASLMCLPLVTGLLCTVCQMDRFPDPTLCTQVAPEGPAQTGGKGKQRGQLQVLMTLAGVQAVAKLSCCCVVRERRDYNRRPHHHGDGRVPNGAQPPPTMRQKERAKRGTHVSVHEENNRSQETRWTKTTSKRRERS